MKTVGLTFDKKVRKPKEEKPKKEQETKEEEQAGE